MLTDRDVHYLAAILTQISSPAGVELELGAKVMDEIAEKKRDVDITVRCTLDDGDTNIELHGIEVKNENRPLDVVHVEQIIQKLGDMSSLSRHALVSATGFTKPAKKKAGHYKLELYHLRDWDGGGLRTVDMSQFSEMVFESLTWEHVTASPIIQDAHPDGRESETIIYGPDQLAHFPSNPELRVRFGVLLDRAVDTGLNSARTTVANVLGDASIIVDAIVPIDQPFQLQIADRTITSQHIRVQGVASARQSRPEIIRKCLIADGAETPIAGCVIQELPDRTLFILMASPTTGLLLRAISIEDRDRVKIVRHAMEPLPPSLFTSG